MDGAAEREGFRSRALHLAEPRLLRGSVLHRCAGHHRPEGADPDGPRERGGGGQAPRGTRPVSDRLAAEEHRTYRADPRPGRAAERLDRASPRGYLRTFTFHVKT